MAVPAVLQFQPFTSAIDVTFWHELADKKVNIFHLSEDPVDIAGFYATGHHTSLPSRMCLSSGAFDGNFKPPPYHFSAPGRIINSNTVENFKALDKKQLFADVTEQIRQDIETGAAVTNPSLLNRFLVVAFADLKKYRYTYMVGYPGIMMPVAVTAHPAVPISEALSESEIASLRSAFDAVRQSGGTPPVAFLIKRNGAGGVEIADLSAFDGGFFSNEAEVTVGFIDPCPLASNPGWPLRNLLALIKIRWKISKLGVLCFRENPGKNDISASIFLMVQLPGEPPAGTFQAVGWEKNPKAKGHVRQMDLASMMDPTRLADTSVDLNLRLMRWRLLPSLDLDRVASTKCLLLGSGTLGCNVARGLLGWGVRNITMVDNGRVSFSNPVRQSLFTFADCMDGGKPKAQAAADMLKAIFPNVNAKGVTLNIPMPGHAVGDLTMAASKKSVEDLTALIADHDVVYLLMDSRESRWLPSLLCASMNKLVINTALGFDTYVIIRHGAAPDATPPEGCEYTRLGCYFCNDVVAPTDSLADRTLDQQCTVTRPGLSMVASALAVELTVSTLHHPHGLYAAADSSVPLADRTEEPLGLIPHTVRGFLTHYQNLLFKGLAYDKCTACSETVVNEYRQRGFDFLMQVFNNPTYLEDLSGLTKLKAAADDLDWDASFEDDGDDF